ncbi:MAG TPA: rod shape-determining protein MreC [Bryobacteraceae bacterium]|jgi:rod shape-determining protein MreC|nr:rod shape-determining protein MreC [Bryobacteraceae bacterium]
MEALLSRFRNLTVLVVAVVAQLLYLAYQVKTNGDERLIRVWAVTAVTPLAGIVEAIRHNTIGFLEDYFILLDVREQNRKLKAANDRLQMENIYFRNQLATAEHARALVQFQSQTPSRTIAARVIGNSTVASAKAVFIDRGSTSGVENGMAVVTPEGIVGKVVAVYPLVAQVLLVTDATFKVGVESQKGHVHGVLDCGSGKCVVEQVQNEDRVDPGEWFYTSGEDRIFPKGFPVGKVISSQPGQGMRDLKLTLSASPGAAEEVLVVVQGVHQAIPTKPPPTEEEVDVHQLPPPPKETGRDAAADAKPQTEADKVLAKYDSIGKEQGHVFGGLGSGIPNFNVKKPASPAEKPDGAAGAGKPAAAPTAPVKPVTNGAPAILGARPGSNPQALPTPKPAVNEPVLPLGAPRRKTPPSTATSTAPQP